MSEKEYQGSPDQREDPPHLQRLPSPSRASSKRKYDHGEELHPESLMNKRQRQQSDLSGDVVLSANAGNNYERLDSVRHQDDSGPMPLPPTPRRKAVGAEMHLGATDLNQQLKGDEEDSTSRETTVEVKKTLPRIDTRKIVERLEPSPLLTPLTSRQTPGLARIVDQSASQPENGDSIQTRPQRKRRIEEVEVEDEHPARFAPKKRQAVLHTSGEHTLLSSLSQETPLAKHSRKMTEESTEDPSLAYSQFVKMPNSLNPRGEYSPMSSSSTRTPLSAASRKRNIEDVEDASPTDPTYKRKRMPSDSGNTDLLLSSPFNPPERSTSILGPHVAERSIDSGFKGVNRDLKPPSQESYSREYLNSIRFRLNDAKPAVLSSSQSKAIDGVCSPEPTSTYDQPTAHPVTHDVTLHGGTTMQDHGIDVPVSPEPDSGTEHQGSIGKDPDGTTLDPEHPTTWTNTNVGQNSVDGPEQTAMSVVIPLQTSPRRPTANQELLPYEDTSSAPVIRSKGKQGRKPNTKDRKAPQKEPDREQGKRKPQTRGRKDRWSKLERERQAYVGRLRSGIGERKHERPSKYFFSPLSLPSTLIPE